MRFLVARKRKRNWGEKKLSPIYGMFHVLIYIFAYLKAVSSVIYTKKEKLL
jgi:hypothetical protein